MALPDRALQVLDLMTQRGFGDRPLLFICHSLGGLVAKQILRASAESEDQITKKIFDATRGVLFLATPHTGSDLASRLDAFRAIFGTTVAMEDLRAHDPHLRELLNWYRNNPNKAIIRTVTYYETRPVYGFRIV